MNSRILGWCGLSYSSFFCLASVMAGCAAGSLDRTSALKSRPGNVQIGKASYERRRIARSFWEAAREQGAEPILVEMLPRGTSGEEPPFTTAALMALSDVLLCPTTKSLSHTRARQNASRRHVRIASLPGITEKMASRWLTLITRRSPGDLRQ
jgi:hypothetical protein